MFVLITLKLLSSYFSHIHSNDVTSQTWCDVDLSKGFICCCLLHLWPTEGSERKAVQPVCRWLHVYLERFIISGQISKAKQQRWAGILSISLNLIRHTTTKRTSNMVSDDQTSGQATECLLLTRLYLVSAQLNHLLNKSIKRLNQRTQNYRLPAAKGGKKSLVATHLNQWVRL